MVLALWPPKYIDGLLMIALETVDDIKPGPGTGR